MRGQHENGSGRPVQRADRGPRRSTLLRTQVCDVLGITHPILQAGMASYTSPALVAAVSNAGRLGVHGTVGRDAAAQPTRSGPGRRWSPRTALESTAHRPDPHSEAAPAPPPTGPAPRLASRVRAWQAAPPIRSSGASPVGSGSA